MPRNGRVVVGCDPGRAVVSYRTAAALDEGKGG